MGIMNPRKQLARRARNREIRNARETVARIAGVDNRGSINELLASADASMARRADEARERREALGAIARIGDRVVLNRRRERVPPAVRIESHAALELALASARTCRVVGHHGVSAEVSRATIRHLAMSMLGDAA
jgi:hypothetical protein